MKMYRVYNGVFDEFRSTPVSVLVIVEHEQRALERGESYFKAAARFANHNILRPPLAEEYWNNLRVELICEDTSQEWTGM